MFGGKWMHFKVVVPHPISGEDIIRTHEVCIFYVFNLMHLLIYNMNNSLGLKKNQKSSLF